MSIKHAARALENLTNQKLQYANEKIDRRKKLEEFAVNNNVSLPENYKDMPELELTKFIRTKAEENTLRDKWMSEGLDLNILNAPEYQGLSDREKYLKGYTNAKQIKDVEFKLNTEGLYVPDYIKNNLPEMQKFYKAIDDTKRGINTPYFNEIQRQMIEKNAKGVYDFLLNSDKVDKETLKTKYENKHLQLVQDLYAHADENVKNELEKLKSFAKQYGVIKTDEEWTNEYKKLLNLQNPEQLFPLIQKDWENEQTEWMKNETAKIAASDTFLKGERNIALEIASATDFSNPAEIEKMSTKLKSMGLNDLQITEQLENAKKTISDKRRELLNKFDITDDLITNIAQTQIPFTTNYLTTENLIDGTKINDNKFIEVLNKVQNYKTEYNERVKLMQGLKNIQSEINPDIINPSKTSREEFYEKYFELKKEDEKNKYFQRTFYNPTTNQNEIGLFDETGNLIKTSAIAPQRQSSNGTSQDKKTENLEKLYEQHLAQVSKIPGNPLKENNDKFYGKKINFDTIISSNNLYKTIQQYNINGVQTPPHNLNKIEGYYDPTSNMYIKKGTEIYNKIKAFLDIKEKLYREKPEYFNQQKQQTSASKQPENKTQSQSKQKSNNIIPGFSATR